MHIVKNFSHFDLYYFTQSMSFQHTVTFQSTSWKDKACLICEEDTFYIQLKHGRKTIYLSTRRFFSYITPLSEARKAFDRYTEEEKAPKALNSAQVYEQVKRLMSSCEKWSKIQLKRMCERSDQYFLIFHIGSVYLWDTAMMSRMLRKLCVIVLLEHYSIYTVRLRIGLK